MVLGKVFSFLTDSNEKALKRLTPLVNQINSLEAEFRSFTDEQLRAKTEAFRLSLTHGATLDQLLPEAFAAVREAAGRTIGQRHFDEQLMGGIVLHHGKIAEMKTGEGKTLVATLPVYLNALAGYGIHVVTVNDYLAKRDPEWMAPIYDFLGLSVGCLQNQGSFIYDPSVTLDETNSSKMRPTERKNAYACDITYGTNNEFGFDYLRDNMIVDLSQNSQRGLYYAIVDEVDNILIDEARTPLIISGPAQESTQMYSNFARLVPRLNTTEDYTVDERHKTVGLTDSGVSKIETWLNIDNLYDPDNYSLTHYVGNALRALVLYGKDKEYVVKDGEVIIVDDFTGRLMPGRRYSDGLHQAIEAKEGVRVQRESITYATITLQNYFRMYDKLAGMTGTAATEAEELSKIYKLEVVAMPTHEDMIRQDASDLVYPTEKAKFNAIADDVEQLNERRQPVLIGTVSIEKSEELSSILKRRGIKCEILNAKQHEMEAKIVSQAGRPGSITVATNMAGRGTDIILGGNISNSDLTPEEWQKSHDEVVSLGGLHIIGTERHESRRIDNQLRGRSGRQGDPGSSRFYVSLEDEVMRRFGGDRVKGIMEWAGFSEDAPIENRLVSKSIEASQTKVESFHFEIRKNLVEYDDVANMHRSVIYAERNKVLTGADLKTNISEMIHREISGLITQHMQDENSDNWEIDAFLTALAAIFPEAPDINRADLFNMHQDEIDDALISYADNLYESREANVGPENMRTVERLVMLRTIDSLWVQHLTSMENLRQGIGLQAFGQRDPLVMFKREGHEMFQDLLGRIQTDIVHTIFRANIDNNSNTNNTPKRTIETPISKVAGRQRQVNTMAGGNKIGRNNPCPCGSGKKYKRCHGMAA